jgi:hypothetical protein
MWQQSYHVVPPASLSQALAIPTKTQNFTNQWYIEILLTTISSSVLIGRLFNSLLKLYFPLLPRHPNSKIYRPSELGASRSFSPNICFLGLITSWKTARRPIMVESRLRLCATASAIGKSTDVHSVHVLGPIRNWVIWPVDFIEESLEKLVSLHGRVFEGPCSESTWGGQFGLQMK